MKTLKELIAKREEDVKKAEQAFEAGLEEFFGELKDRMVEITLSNEAKETTIFKSYSYYGQAGIIVIHGEDQDGKFQPVPVMQISTAGICINSIKAI